MVISISAFLIASCRSSITSGTVVIDQSDSLALYPYWIEMMNDSNVNYHNAVLAFDKYWENRNTPTEDNGEAKDIFGKQKSPEEKAEEDSRSLQYVVEYKQFLHWKQTNQNLVKPDGTIMTPEEILKQWEQQKNNRTRK